MMVYCLPSICARGPGHGPIHHVHDPSHGDRNHVASVHSSAVRHNNMAWAQSPRLVDTQVPVQHKPAAQVPHTLGQAGQSQTAAVAATATQSRRGNPHRPGPLKLHLPALLTVTIFSSYINETAPCIFHLRTTHLFISFSLNKSLSPNVFSYASCNSSSGQSAEK
jgi:hypothetical protein